MATNDQPVRPPEPRGGLLRRLLKLMVAADSSRRAGGRLKAALVLLGLLAVFAALGYGVPAVLSHYIAG
ncbi:MAG: hypothetical protein ACK4VM_00275 [Bosea sp. (in: a-proteobacteria)]